MNSLHQLFLRRRTLCRLVLLPGILAAGNSLAQNLILNDSFESPGFAGSYAQYYGPSNAAITNWTLGPGHIVVHHSPDAGNNVNPTFNFAHDGNYYLDLSSSGGAQAMIYQDFATIPQQSYELSFYIGASNYGVPTGPTINVTVSGAAALLNSTLTPAGPGININWTLNTFRFVADAATTRLSFVDVSGIDDNASYVDTVRVVPLVDPLAPTTIYFDQLNYAVREGTIVSGSVKIDPIPPGGLYSQGTRIDIRSLNGDYAGYITPTPSAKLDFNGIFLAAGSRHAPNTGLAVVKGSASFTDLLRPTEVTQDIATFTVGAIPAGNYTMELSPWNDLGPTENIFVTGDCRSVDSLLTFRPSFIAVESADPLASLAICIVTEPNLAPLDPNLDPPTGHIKQDIRVTNVGSAAANSFRIFVESLPSDVTLLNRSGIIDGVPYLDILQPLAAGASVNLSLEYLRENGQLNFTPTFRIPTIQTPQNPNPEGVSNLNLRVVQVTGSGALLEFASGTGTSYSVEYTDDLTTWKVCQPLIKGNGAKIQILDNGLPKTATFPGMKRFYRITTPFCPL